MPSPDRDPILVQLHDLGRLAYRSALDRQRQAHAAVLDRRSPPQLLLVEHDPVVTLGRRGSRDGILNPDRLAQLGIDIVHSERGGDVTYHGPGQLVAYPILPMRDFAPDIRSYVLTLEAVVLRLLDTYGVAARRDPDMHGVFTAVGKIASVGVHVSRGVTSYGLALNVDPDDDHWRCIDPCAQPGVVAVSLRSERGLSPSMSDVKRRFRDAFAAEFHVGLTPCHKAPRA